MENKSQGTLPDGILSLISGIIKFIENSEETNNKGENNETQ
ncbi:hypothetical protein FACS189490_05460 [Clostridia bacterium]|nr:hypothetical protein FACS189490_05460 [Clostridia bacterium]